MRNGRGCFPEVQYKMTATDDRSRSTEDINGLAPLELGRKGLMTSNWLHILIETYPGNEECHRSSCPRQGEATTIVSMACP